ncbi:MAG: efflux RND transporter periplasmic adaptor subunit [Trichlorobacter sp.]|jgi:RND family efflux transporter MFP subunit|nr:efflux RND transporter periplasmic adaptor subunit [Trichlorobacter sp.]
MNLKSVAGFVASRWAVQGGRMFILPLLAFLMIASAADANNGRQRIQLTAYQQATISTEISANVLQMPLKDGAAFKKGDLLVSFDCAIIEAQLQKAEAAADAARSAQKVNERLNELEALSILEYEQSLARVKEAEAELAAMQVSASRCEIKAPYDGRVVKLYADPYQYLTPGKPVMDILDTSRLEVRMLVPSRWLAWLKPGSRFTVSVEELGGRSFPAQVVRVGGRIDPLSQTASIAGEIIGNFQELLPGMSGWASFGKK